MTEYQSLSDAGSPSGSAQVGPSRRRLFKGLAAGTGVMLAVPARTALGQVACQSPSARMSGNTSVRPGSGITCSGGRSPGFWKVPQKFQYWTSTGATPATFKVPVSECSAGMQGITLADIDTHGTLVMSHFTGLSPAKYTNVGFWEVLAFPTSFPGGSELRHFIAAWLNAGYFKTDAAKYPLSQQQVVDMWAATLTGAYCPPSLGSCSAGWDRATVVSYISSMYDLNAGVEPSLCKP